MVYKKILIFLKKIFFPYKNIVLTLEGWAGGLGAGWSPALKRAQPQGWKFLEPAHPYAENFEEPKFLRNRFFAKKCKKVPKPPILADFALFCQKIKFFHFLYICKY